VNTAAAAASLALNLVFIATFGIGGLGAVLVALTTILLVAIAVRLRS
jgi:O-antigen/teichoic acid export membrane protein